MTSSAADHDRPTKVLTQADPIRCAAGSEKDVISLLLEEYKQLKAEISNRFATRSQVLSLASVAAALLIATSGTRPAPRFLYVALLALLGYTWWFVANHNAVQVAKRIRELELQIDDLARTAYGVSPGPLRWEITAFDRRARYGPVMGWVVAAMGWGRKGIPAPGDPGSEAAA